MPDSVPTPPQALTRFTHTLGKILFAVAVACSGLMLVPTTLDVLGRAFLSTSVPGAAELVSFLLLGLIFASLPLLNDQRAQLRVELFIFRMPPLLRNALEWTASAAGLIFFALMARAVGKLAWTKIHVGEVSLMLGLPVGWPQFFAALCLGALCLSLFLQLVDMLASSRRNGTRPSILLGCGLTALLCALPFLLHPLFADGGHLALLGGLGMGFLLLLLLIGLPIGMVMAGVAYMGLLALYPGTGSANLMLGLAPVEAATNYAYAVIPMFVLMGELALCAGISADLFRAASLWLGRLPGGLAIATVAGCAGFAAVSGDSMATAVTMASVALPEMEKHHYDPGLACATLAAGGTLGILIPPSTGFIFYALVTEESIGKLFVAGIIPGLVLALLFCIILLLFALRRPDLAPRGETHPLRERLASLWGVVPMLWLIGLILGGILTGWFSPNEAGAVGAAGTLVYALARRRLTWRGLRDALVSTTVITSRLMLILLGVGLLSAFFAATQLPARLAESLVELHMPRQLFMTAIIAFYMLLGCVMNVVPMMLLTLPALFPAVQAMGFSSVWFGVIVVVMMEMGQITPPVGLNVYGMAAVARHVPIADIFRRITPFFLSMLILIITLMIWPELATWLPDLLFS